MSRSTQAAKRVAYFMALLLCVSGVAPASEPQAERHTLLVCDGERAYPPFIFVPAEGNGVLSGYSVELLERLLRDSPWKPQFQLLPWSRCLRDVEAGRAQLALNGSDSPERQQRFRVSPAIAYTTEALFYLQERFPSPPVQRRTELAKFRICGVANNNYSSLDLPAQALDLSANTLASAFRMLQQQRCDVLPYTREVVHGHQLLGTPLFGPAVIAEQTIPEQQPKGIHMLITRQPEGEALQTYLAGALAALHQSGELQALAQKWRIAATP